MSCYHLRLLNTESKVWCGRQRRAGRAAAAVPEERRRRRCGACAPPRRRGRQLEGPLPANLDRIKTGDLDEVVDVLLCLADVARRKTLSFRERKMFDHARQLLVYEVAAVKGKPAEKVERDIEKALQVQPEPVDEG